MRGRGYDVIAVSERDDLRGSSDSELFAHARAAGFVIVTQNYADFDALVREARIAQVEHPGVVFVPTGLWGSIADLEALVEALAQFLDEDNFAADVMWLR